MRDFLMFLMGSGGLTIVITASYLMRPAREFFNRENRFMAFMYKLLTCAMCTGMWIGAIMTVLRYYFPFAFEIAAGAGATSLFAFFAHKSMQKR